MCWTRYFQWKLPIWVQTFQHANLPQGTKCKGGWTVWGAHHACGCFQCGSGLSNLGFSFMAAKKLPLRPVSSDSCPICVFFRKKVVKVWKGKHVFLPDLTWLNPPGHKSCNLSDDKVILLLVKVVCVPQQSLKHTKLTEAITVSPITSDPEENPSTQTTEPPSITTTSKSNPAGGHKQEFQFQLSNTWFLKQEKYMSASFQRWQLVW